MDGMTGGEGFLHLCRYVNPAAIYDWQLRMRDAIGMCRGYSITKRWSLH